MAKSQQESRREFLQKLIASSAALGMAPLMGGFNGFAAPAMAGKMAVRPLGKTGFMVPLFSLGGQGSIEIPGKEDISVEIINRAIDLGVRYLDTAAA